MTAISMQTFGCKLNFSETTSIGKKLKEGGHSIVDSIQQADIHIINSCTVTEHAEKKCRQAIRHAVSVNPSIKIIIIGCYSQLRPEELAEMPNVVFVCGNETKFKLPEIIDGMTKDTIKISSPDDSKHFSYHPAISDDSRTRSFLKIQDGCDYFCTYCAIPYSRGRSRSDTVENVIKSARQAVDDGKKEIVLDGVNIGEFGKKNGESLYMLLNELIAIDGLKRIRISSIEPNLLESRIINLLSETDKLMPHFHIPLQCGSDRILKLMHRRYDTSFFRDKLLEIKAIKPLCCLAVDLITGFPGETTQDFADCESFIESVPISYLHVFSYSDRPEAVASKYTDKVPGQEKTRRSEELHKLSDKKWEEFLMLNKGTVHDVLFERRNEAGCWVGWTDNYIGVELDSDEDLHNVITEVRL